MITSNIYTNDASFPQDDLSLVLELLAISDKYFIINLKRKCEHILSTKINVDSVLPIYSYAKVLSPSVLAKVCAKFILQEFAQLVDMEGGMEALHEILDRKDK